LYTEVISRFPVHRQFWRAGRSGESITIRYILRSPRRSQTALDRGIFAPKRGKDGYFRPSPVKNGHKWHTFSQFPPTLHYFLLKNEKFTVGRGPETGIRLRGSPKRHRHCADTCLLTKFCLNTALERISKKVPTAGFNLGFKTEGTSQQS
jgi:hypothetical protein